MKKLTSGGWRVAVAAVVLALSGCASNPKAGNLEQAVTDYNAQRYSQAQERATAIQGQAKTGVKEDAAYVAGLSAYQLGQSDQAEQQLTIAAKSPDAQTAAKARAMLGELRLDQHRPRDAAALFAEAAPALQGEDARRCAYNASVAYQQAGDLTSARKWQATANGGNGGASGGGGTIVASTGGSRAAVGNFTLQVGAFREKKRAQQAADEAQKLAQRDGLGQVRILPRRDERGKPLYLVQFGSFATRDAAAAARAKLGRLEYIVAPTAGTSS